MLRQLSVFLILCIISIAAVEVNGMSLFKGEKVCIASGFEGRVTMEGKPAAGARIVRKFNWKDEKGETEETVADEDGRFGFPSHWDVLRRLLPLQFVVNQNIFVHYNGQEYQVWGTGKMQKSEYSEFGGAKPKNFRCELTDREIRGVSLEVGFVATTCYWDQAEQNEEDRGR
jgi:hypothetical protein